MTRPLDIGALEGYAKDVASWWLQDKDWKDPAGKNKLFPMSRAWVKNEFRKLVFKDAFEKAAELVAESLGARPGVDFDEMLAQLRREHPRSEAEFHSLLAEKLAIDPDGQHIPGKIGTTQVGARCVGMREVTVEAPWSIKRRKRLGIAKSASTRELISKVVREYWPIYAGEIAERLADSGVADRLPPGVEPLPVGALNTRISNECAILAADAVVDNLDEGTGAAVLTGRTGAQPTDPDTAATGTLLFTLVCTDPAFGAAADAAPGAIATASAITDDTSADATGTLGYVRASSTNDGATPLDDHIDGEAGTSGADWNFNTLSIVAGATVSATSWTVTMPES